MFSLPSKTVFTSSINLSLSAGEETSQTVPVTLKFFFFHSCKHLFSSASFLEQVCTAAPNPANSSTMQNLGEEEECHRSSSWVGDREDDG